MITGMKMYTTLFGILLAFPSVTFAAYASQDNLQGYLVLIGQFINNTILPLIFTIALLFFLVNAARYFVFGGANEDGQDKARRMALYGIGAFTFLVSIWGIINMLVSSLGIDDSQSKCPDFLGNWCSENGSGSGYSNYGGGSSSNYSQFGGSGSNYGGSGSNYSNFGGSGSNYGGSGSNYSNFGGSGSNYNASGSAANYNNFGGSAANYSN